MRACLLEIKLENSLSWGVQAWVTSASGKFPGSLLRPHSAIIVRCPLLLAYHLPEGRVHPLSSGHSRCLLRSLVDRLCSFLTAAVTN